MSLPAKDSFMRFAIIYGLRSLWRNRRRSTLTLLTVMFSVAFTITGRRFGDSMMTLWKVGSEDTGTAHAQVHADGYLNASGGLQRSTTLSPNNQVETALAHDPNIEAVTRRLELEGMIAPYHDDYAYDEDGDPVEQSNKVIYFTGIGVDPNSEQKVSPKLFVPGVKGSQDRGQFISDSQPEGIVIGSGMADTLDLDIGDEASLLAHTVDGSQNAVDVKIVGIINVPLPTFSKRVLYMHISLAQKLVRLDNNYTELAIRLRDREMIEGWLDSLRPLASATQKELRGWWEIDPVIRNVESIMNAVINIISALLFLSAGLSLLNMIYVLVAERTVEIGTLLAIGAKAADIRRIFTLEAAMIGVIGGVLGAIVGNLTIFIMGLKGIALQNPFASGMILLRPKVSVEITGIVTALAVIMCIVAALAPSAKAAKIEPVQAFRGQIT